MRNRLRSGRVELVGRLPVHGSAHPLQKNATRVLYRSTLITALLFGLGPAAAVLVDQLRTEVPARAPLPSTHIYHPLPPPPIAHDRDPGQTVVVDPGLQGIGVPDPVPDFEADFSSLVDVSEILDVIMPPALADPFGPGDTLVVELPTAPSLPSPQDFVSVEVEPALVQLPSPVYPEMARLAGVEGTVVVRVLVGTKGNVLDTILIEGHVMLQEAALSSARGAVYRPALQQNHPIPVWVLQRITFKLN